MSVYSNEIDNNDYELIIRTIPLTKDVLVEKRRNIRKSIILAGLSKFKEKTRFTVDDLINKIKNITKCTINHAIIIRTLNELEKDGTIKHIGQLEYALEKDIEIPSFQEKTERVWKDFLQYLGEKYPDYDGYIDRDVRELFDDILLKLLLKFKISSDLLDKQIESLPYESFKKEIETIVENYSLSKILSKKFPNIIYTYLQSSSRPLYSFIYGYYSSIINVDIVMREQEIPKIDFASNLKFLLVDTSFLVASMCVTDRLYPITSAVIHQCSKYNIPLYYSEKTKDEMQSLISGSKKEMGSFTKSRKPVIRSQFVRDFQNKNVSWSDYTIFLDSWQKHVESHHNITVLPKDFENRKIDENLYQYVINTLPILSTLQNEERSKSNPDYIPKIREEAQIEHDAYCLGLISHLKKEITEEEVHLGPLFLTFDNLLSGLNTSYFSESDEVGLLIQPRTLLNYLLIYSKIDFEEEERDNIAQAIIKFMISERERNLEPEDYIRLVTYKVGLNESDIEIMKEIFLKSPLLHELKKALESDRGDLADDIAYRILGDEDYINLIIGERKSREKLKNVREKLKETEKKLAEERAAREALEKATESNTNISITNKINIIVDVDTNLQNEINGLISILESENAFKEGLIEEPRDISTKERLMSWLKSLKEAIEASTTISEGIKATLPLIVHLISKLRGA